SSVLVSIAKTDLHADLRTPSSMRDVHWSRHRYTRLIPPQTAKCTWLAPILPRRGSRCLSPPGSPSAAHAGVADRRACVLDLESLLITPEDRAAGRGAATGIRHSRTGANPLPHRA